MSEQPDNPQQLDFASTFEDLKAMIDDADEAAFTQAARIAIVIAYQARGWQGDIKDEGDVYLAHEDYGHAWFDQIIAAPNYTSYRSYWCRDDGRVPDLREEKWTPMASRDESPQDFCAELVRSIMEEPMYGPNFFETEYQRDPDFEEPDYAEELEQEAHAEIELDDFEFEGAVSAVTGLSIEDAEDNDGPENLIA